MSNVRNEAPGPSRRAVILTAPEADALRGYVAGDHFDVDMVSDAIRVIDAVLGEGRWGDQEA